MSYRKSMLALLIVGGLALATAPLVRAAGPALSEREESVLRAYASGLTLDAAARRSASA